MSLYNKLVDEYKDILETDFWPLYLARIKQYRDVLSRQCETEDNPTKVQGSLVAIDYILGRNEQPNLAERLLAESKKK